VLVYLGIILSLGQLLSALKVDSWLTVMVHSLMPYAFVLVVALLAFCLRFFVPWTTASTILALVTMPIAGSLGFSPFIPAFVVLVAGNHTLLPHLNPAYQIMYAASEGALYTHEQARRVLALEALFRLAALLVSVPYWQALGLM
jgi:hypothetical protein